MEATEPFLGVEAEVPLDRPFTRAEARARGVSDRQLAAWTSRGLLVNPMRGLFHAAQLPDGLDLRLSCLALVVPPDAVVTGRTAGWLHGAPMVLAPGDHRQVPAVSVHLTPGNRLRNPMTVSGERRFLARDLVEVEGVTVTSRLRTTVDLGMGLRREQAFAALCSMATTGGFDRDELCDEIRERGRFAGYRGVRQIRALEPWVDPRFGSPAECLLALSWHDLPDLPAFVPQHPVSSPAGMFYLDLAVPALKYAAEYDGQHWHGEDRTSHDAARRAWLVEHEQWIIDVFTDGDVYGPGRDPGLRLRMGLERARRRFGSLSWRGQTHDGEPWLG